MSPSRICDKGPLSIACSHLIALPDRRDGSATSSLRMIDSAITLRILSPTPEVNHRFTGGPLTRRRYRGGTSEHRVLAAAVSRGVLRRRHGLRRRGSEVAAPLPVRSS